MFWLPSPSFPSSPSHPEFARNMQKTLKSHKSKKKDRQLKMHLYKKKTDSGHLSCQNADFMLKVVHTFKKPHMYDS